jgi:uncharacterized protein (DUF1330 family)
MSNDDPTSDDPVWLIIQGRLILGEEDTYERYLDGTQPLLEEYDVEIVGVGEGQEASYTTGTWPRTAILSFPSREAADAFFQDPRYQELKETYRDAAYEELRVSLFAPRPPRM